MEILPQKRPSPADLGPGRDGEGRIEEGHVGKKGRFEKATTGKQKAPASLPGDEVRDVDGSIEDENCEDRIEEDVGEDEIEEGHSGEDANAEGDVEEDGHVEKAVSFDPFDLPDEIVLQIFKTGTSLQLAEMVSDKWRSKIQSTPDFWKNACTRISVHEGNITQQLRKRLESDKPKWENKALVWKEIWSKYRAKICRHCLSDGGWPYPLFGNVVLCWPCRNLEPYNALTTTQARKYFKIHTKKVQKKMKEEGIKLKTDTYENSQRYTITLYKFTQLADMARTVKGEEVANEMVEKYRRATRTKKMEGVHLKEV